MMVFGPIGFLSPWLLAGLLSLPVIWWLLRITPPRPAHILFPPTRLLRDIEQREQTTAHSPWWLTALRLLLAALVILALARPLLNPEKAPLPGEGPLALIVDNGWASANRWAARKTLLKKLIERAGRAGRRVLILPTAIPPAALKLTPLSTRQAQETAAALLPQPNAPQRAALLDKMKSFAKTSAKPGIVWLSDGLDYGGGSEFSTGLGKIAAKGGIVVFRDVYNSRDADLSGPPLGLHAGLDSSGQLNAKILRAGGGARAGRVIALNGKGQVLGNAAYAFSGNAPTTDTQIELPLELRNQVSQLRISGQRSAGSVFLLDGRSRWRRVGIISGESSELAQPLLSPLYYVRKALLPHAELSISKDRNIAKSVDKLLGVNVSVLVLANIGRLSGETLEKLKKWTDNGGILLRFAGPRLEKGGDELLPVPLRKGGRSLGGALSWSTPQKLGPFDERSPFYGLKQPDDIEVNRQVLADPTLLGSRAQVWARLKDGTPLVTAAGRGKGQVVLFHVTANSGWSNLPHSGLFVEMLRRIVMLSGGAPLLASDGLTGTDSLEAAGESTGLDDLQQTTLKPFQVLDGFGNLGLPPVSANAIKLEQIGKIRPNPNHPPGYYGPPASPRSLNIMTDKSKLASLKSTPSSATLAAYGQSRSVDLKPSLLLAALCLFLFDAAIVLWMSSGAHLKRKAIAAAVALLAIIPLTAVTAPPARAQDKPETPTAARKQAFALKAVSKTRLAYVITGNAQTDKVSLDGLRGLNRLLKARTALEPGAPMGVNPAVDDLSFFPILYWPVLPDAKSLTDKVSARIDAYMKQGGMILFDTRDQQKALPFRRLRGDGSTPLSRLLGKLDIPRLEPVPEGHVVTRSFYLLREFPGRWEGGKLWVEARPKSDTEESFAKRLRRSDGVSSILVTSNDFAAAWALDDQNRPYFPVVPGGKVQREMAFRTGVNIVMYALTGNYKTDQVHIPALLQRLGQ